MQVSNHNGTHRDVSQQLLHQFHVNVPASRIAADGASDRGSAEVNLYAPQHTSACLALPPVMYDSLWRQTQPYGTDSQVDSNPMRQTAI